MNPPSSNEKTLFHTGQRVEVLLPRPFDHGFDYKLPEGMQLRVGAYVSVPFGQKEMIGVVWGAGQQDVPEEKCKSISAHHALWPAMHPSLQALVNWVANYTLAPKGLVLKMVMPIAEAVSKPPQYSHFELRHVEAGKLTPARKAVIEALQAAGHLSATALKQQTGASSAVLNSMLNAQMLRRYEQLCLPSRMHYQPRPAPTLREEQANAAKSIENALGMGFSAFALEGVTGSGKTEVYFDSIEQILQHNEGQILVLLPEIALTSQWMERFEKRFGNVASLWHSSVSPAKRRHIWQAVASGAAPLVVGARSALFLPYRNLQLIIVDEEHEPSYKQEEGVLYHARDMAVARAKFEQCPIVLASATLSLETMANVQAKKYQHLQLNQRHGVHQEPTPTLIDLRQDKPEQGAFISPSLREALLATKAQGHQSMLFLNRRGYAPLLLCRGCGHRFECPNCSAWMVSHSRPARLQCHHCDWRQPLPKHCPECDSDELVPCGPGVERIAEEVAELLPDAQLALLSSDEKELSSQIAAVLSGEIDIIIGTQMVAKGHHFPKLALVGVIDGDIGLEGGDLRASERSYQLLHQLAGRAGREGVEGRVMLQTSQPEHPLMQALAAGDREGFMSQEMRIREGGGWPPYGRLASLLFEGFDEASVKAAALTAIQGAPRYGNVTYLGPAPAPIARARNRYRYRILLKAGKGVALQKLINQWIKPLHFGNAVKLKVDIDPYSFM